MRGRVDPQISLLAFVDLEDRVPPDHPLPAIKRWADKALASLSGTFDAMYVELVATAYNLVRLSRLSPSRPAIAAASSATCSPQPPPFCTKPT